MKDMNRVAHKTIDHKSLKQVVEGNNEKMFPQQPNSQEVSCFLSSLFLHTILLHVGFAE